MEAEQRELMALGENRLLEWLPQNGLHRIWQIDEGLTLGKGPVFEGGPTVGMGHLLYSLGGRTMLAVRPLAKDWVIYGVNVFATQTGSTAIQPQLGTDSWMEPFWGHEVLALDDDRVLKWWPGTGVYEVRQHVRSGQNDQLLLTSFQGQANALLRGARLVNLGMHRLLEWVPVTREYRIWAYHFNEGESPIFDAAPVASGLWTDLGPRADILVVDSGPSSDRRRLLVWDRDTGMVTVSELDPLADDPRTASSVSTEYARLRSLDFTPRTQSNIKNVVLFLQRGRSFDSYFGQYCQGPPGVPMTCEDGPACCERMPETIEGALACTPLDLGSPAAHVPDASTACLAHKMNDGKMDGYARDCGAPPDFACAGAGPGAGPLAAYHALASTGALADRFFQSTIIGDALNAEINAIYLSKAALGSSVASESGNNQLTFLMAQADVRYAIYVQAPNKDPQVQSQPPPLFYDSHWTTYRWLDELSRDIDREQLADISIVVTPPSLNEEPGPGIAGDGIDFVATHIAALDASLRYRPTTLALLAYLSTGGYYDHVPPPVPPPLDVDYLSGTGDGGLPENVPVSYGPRLPFLATGVFARRDHISHVPLELSSITTFFEWNWKEGKVGQLHHRDKFVANLGSLLDSTVTGVEVPALPPAP